MQPSKTPIEIGTGTRYESAAGGGPFHIVTFSSKAMRPSRWWMKPAPSQCPIAARFDHSVDRPAAPSSGVTLSQAARLLGLPSDTAPCRISMFVARRTEVRFLSAAGTADEKRRDEELFARAGISLGSIATALWLDPELLKERRFMAALQSLVNVLPLPVLKRLLPYEGGLKALSAGPTPAEQSQDWLDRAKIALPRIAAALGMTRLDPGKDGDLQILGALEGWRDVAPTQSLELLLTRGPNIARFS